VGLTSPKTHKEFCDHMIHAVERHRQLEHSRQEQSKEVQRKLAQLQLEELTKKGKRKTAPPVEPMIMAPVVQQAPPQWAPTPTQQPQSQSSPAVPALPIVYSGPQYNDQYPNNEYRQSQLRQNRRPQGQLRYQRQGPPNLGQDTVICYGCNREGHIRTNCQINPDLADQLQQGQRYRNQGYWVRDTRGAQRIYRLRVSTLRSQSRLMKNLCCRFESMIEAYP